MFFSVISNFTPEVHIYLVSVSAIFTGWWMDGSKCAFFFVYVQESVHHLLILLR